MERLTVEYYQDIKDLWHYRILLLSPTYGTSQGFNSLYEAESALLKITGLTQNCILAFLYLPTDCRIRIEDIDFSKYQNPL